MRNKVGCGIIALIVIVFVLVTFIVGFFCAGIISDKKTPPEEVMNLCGLSNKYSPDFWLEGKKEWIGDHFRIVMFRIEKGEARRSVLSDTYKCTNWHQEKIGSNELSAFLIAYTWSYTDVIEINQTTSFDAWFYENISSEDDSKDKVNLKSFSDIEELDSGFRLAFYSEETGLFIYIEQFE